MNEEKKVVIKKPKHVMRKFTIPAMDGIAAQVVEAKSSKEAVRIYIKNLTK